MLLSMDKNTRFKLIYSGEFIVIAIIFIVIGILELLQVIRLSDTFQLIFKIATLVGATWMTFNFFWTILSKKRRELKGILDAILLFPLAIYLYAYDIAGFVVARPYEYYQIGVPMAFFYIACSYLFIGVYRFFRPTPEVIEILEEEERERIAKASVIAPANVETQEEPKVEENKEEEK